MYNPWNILAYFASRCIKHCYTLLELLFRVLKTKLFLWNIKHGNWASSSTSWSTGICVKKLFCIFEKWLVVCFLIVEDSCVLSMNSMSIYLSSWAYRWSTFTELHFTRAYYSLSFNTPKNSESSKRSKALQRNFPTLSYHFISLPFFFH